MATYLGNLIVTNVAMKNVKKYTDDDYLNYEIRRFKDFMVVCKVIYLWCYGVSKKLSGDKDELKR